MFIFAVPQKFPWLPDFWNRIFSGLSVPVETVRRPIELPYMWKANVRQ